MISHCTIMDGHTHIQKAKLWQVREIYPLWWHRKVLLISYHSRVKNVYSTANVVSFQQMQNSFLVVNSRYLFEMKKKNTSVPELLHLIMYCCNCVTLPFCIGDKYTMNIQISQIAH